MKYAIVVLMTIYAAKAITDAVAKWMNLPPYNDEINKKDKTID